MPNTQSPAGKFALSDGPNSPETPKKTVQKPDFHAPAFPLGSDIWTGADEYRPSPGEPLDPENEETHYLYKRAVEFHVRVDWDAVISIARRLRKGKNCKILPKYSIGIFNLVKRVDFEDGVSWVVRVRMPSLGGLFGRRQLLPSEQAMSIEVAAMKFFKKKTSIPVPELYHYETDPSNQVGAPYMIMEYIHGTPAHHLRLAKGGTLRFGDVEQDRRLSEQMAKIQVELSSFQFDKIGSLYLDEKTDEFYIGPDQETGKGPWTSTTEYYLDYAAHCMETAAIADSRLTERDSFVNPALFSYALRFSENPSRRNGPFYLINGDFGPHNILVNENFEILAVIDFDGVMAAPIEVAAQLPFMAYLDLGPPPGLAGSETPSSTRTSFQQYKEMIRAAEEELNDGKGRDGLLANAIFSKSAMLFSGIAAYGCHSGPVNESWLRTYINMIRNDVVSKALSKQSEK
ncbi:hypothetical protein PRK78_006715 [Emydomyces testavorans]|uniref:Aminoglycoside phosphotransferase domain-containing protein n=1 Tax=Emydomyces testavorans TaxID=2070801 RepID=A0AAF0IKS5_9EURO|nr:hypothetical protein PRK78_006715 [Emydomyces testavorans]